MKAIALIVHCGLPRKRTRTEPFDGIYILLLRMLQIKHFVGEQKVRLFMARIYGR